jgi:hypothetical protein
MGTAFFLFSQHGAERKENEVSSKKFAEKD